MAFRAVVLRIPCWLYRHSMFMCSHLVIYEYSIVIFSIDIGAIAAAAGVLAPIGGALLGLIPASETCLRELGV